MTRQRIIFVVGTNYIRYVDPVLVQLASNADVDVELMDVTDVESRLGELSTADLLITVHSSVLNVMQTLDRLRGTVPSLTLQDGIIEYRSSARRVQKLFRYRPLRTDYIAAFGDRSKSLLCAAGTEPERIFVTGSPRFDHYAKTPVPADGPVLITMANRPAHKPGRVKAFYDILAQTVNYCRTAGVAYKLRLSRGVKPGGVEAFDSTVDLDAAFIKVLEEAAASEPTSLEEDVIAARAVITTPSTVSLESMALGRPVAHLLFDYETTFLQTAWNIRCQEDISDVMTELLNPPKMKQEFQDVILRENLWMGQSTERVVDVILRILDRYSK